MSAQKIKNMEEFAAVSGLSRPTVSKYFNDPDSVRKTTRDRIEAALDRYDYRPNIYAVNQNRRLTKNVGILVPFLADPFFAEIARTIETLCMEAGFRPILLSSHGDRALENENLDSLKALKPAGVLMAPLGRASDRGEIERFCEDVPTVLFDSNTEGVGEDFIGSDNQQSVGMIVDYLNRTGEAPAFFEMAKPVNPNANKRRAAYLAAMDRLGHNPELFQIDGEGWSFEEIGFRGGMELFSRRATRPGTVLCSNDRLAIGLLSAAYESGLSVGHGPSCDIRIAGHDDHPFSRFTCPSLTTVAQDYEAIARKSVARLVERVETESDVRYRIETLIPGKLVMRNSA
ncbi:LacI family transcriptional regulator [Rhodophyticola sp. CCM32]|uniref:LacI family DNA-binding transcriptional regulator n=1 Tax=Rhodophyticola sp. CCM32 TaxID=2916397 RepID=UPI00107F4CA6|nr:LacI family DNA-binding transcriptional regulator [Rhodophyticola sp. CCM32]QBX99523.1 LacI family transcriptional regulator [Rhodophyticola sp. CCM32]